MSNKQTNINRKRVISLFFLQAEKISRFLYLIALIFDSYGLTITEELFWIWKLQEILRFSTFLLYDNLVIPYHNKPFWLVFLINHAGVLSYISKFHPEGTPPSSLFQISLCRLRIFLWPKLVYFWKVLAQNCLLSVML